MVDLVEKRLKIEGLPIKLDLYLHEMLTLRGWWHRFTE
jgi:hypothetical protein